MRVVLVRPWTDAHAGDGCCTGDPRYGVVLERHGDGPAGHERGHSHKPGHGPVHEHATGHGGAALVGEAYRRLRAEHPEVDVQVVGSSNTAFLLPSTFGAVRRRHGVLRALREANRATTAGGVLIDGERIGDLETLGIEGVLGEIAART